MDVLKVAVLLLFLGSLALGEKHGSEDEINDKIKPNFANEANHDSSNRTKRQFILTRFELLPLPTTRSNRFLVIPTQQRQSTNTASNNQFGNIIIQPARIIFQRVLPPVSSFQSQNAISSARQNQDSTRPNAFGFSRPQTTQPASRLRPNAAIIVPLRGANSQQQTLGQSQTPQRIQEVLTQPRGSQQQLQNVQQSFSRPSSNRLSSNVFAADQIFRQTDQDRRRQQQQELFQRQQNLLRAFPQPSQNFQSDFQNVNFGTSLPPFPRLVQNTQSRLRTQQVELQPRPFGSRAFSRPSTRNFSPQNLLNPTTILRSFPFPTSAGGPAVQPTGKQLGNQNASEQPPQGTQQPARVPSSAAQNTVSPPVPIQRPPVQNTSPGFTVVSNTGSNSGGNVGVPLPPVRTSNNILSPNSVTPSFSSQGVGVPLPASSGSNSQTPFNQGQQFFIRPESREIFDNRDILSSREFFDTRELLDSREFFDSRELLRSRELFDTREILSGENLGVLNRRPIFRSSVSDFDRTDEVISSEVFFRGGK